MSLLSTNTNRQVQAKALLEAAQETDSSGLPEVYRAEWGSTSLELIRRLCGATFRLEMRMSADSNYSDIISQQVSLEELRDAVEEEQIDHDELTVHTLAHIEHLAVRLEALARQAAECDARLYCKCGLPHEPEKWEFGVEEVLSKGRSIREYITEHLQRAFAANPDAESYPERVERQAMWSAYHELGRVFQSYIATAPKTAKAFIEVWARMWKSEMFKEALHDDLAARKERAKESVRLKKVHEKTPLRERFKKRGAQLTDPASPSRSIFQTFRSWVSTGN
ncbi:hypothetical protein VUR80DRAFT_2964 [Thermomyces stellatus]